MKFFNKFFSYIIPRQDKSGNLIVHVILDSFLVLSFLLLITQVSEKIRLSDDYYTGSILLAGLGIIILLLVKYLLKVGRRKSTNCCCLFFILFIMGIVVADSGLQNFPALLLMSLYIVSTAIILKGRSFHISIALLFLFYLTLGYMQINQIITPDLSWQRSGMYSINMISTFVILCMTAVISWLFNSEVNRRIFQFDESQSILQKERDLLESKVEERTVQYKNEQIIKTEQFCKFAEFGRLSQGLFHDLINPLTALNLNLSEIKKDENPSEMKDFVDGAAIAADNMGSLIASTRNYFQSNDIKSRFSAISELKSVFLLFNYKAQQSQIKFNLICNQDIFIVGNKTRFSRLITNLLLNAIEAYEDHKRCKWIDKTITVNIQETDALTIISVKDNARGMTKKTMKNLFEPFYTTKLSDNNSGTGLAICKNIVESEFLGKIQIINKMNVGAEFVITLPKQHSI